MSAPDTVLERWLAAAAEVYGGIFAEHTIGERDPFRNPIGHTLRVSLTVLVREFFGAMQPAAIDAAFADIMALRSIQALAVEQAVGFVFGLRGIARATPAMMPADAEARIDKLALSAFQQYLACRERLAELKLNEQLRAFGVARMRAAHNRGSVA
ncbi:MAG: RsbRD N-terminal domain-containing protein [Alphaproteobacteria bacterium]|nr:RsbRD N-terminal domain-containing protein [Alphaproteobacteria bacterium]MDE2011842.1 RsbRD N-terminal domain-containing protein [Alphaproteobacteria bacterium]MDE2074636.1 RsbRD N-terminal domain-containing protein [Alphaproteobacteria bacterium]MDE2352695.1 RsbRD N-terminal domain-containing protein [Alphaproteobacteria bacterium]